MKKYYGLRTESTMCGIQSYFIADTKEEILNIFQMFKAFLESEDEAKVKAWEDFVNNYERNWCDEYYDFAIGEIDESKNLYVLVDQSYRSDNKAYIYEEIINYVGRF